MKVIHKDLKHGRIKLRIESTDDLWHLNNILEIGDLVSAKTFRRLKSREEVLRLEREEKRPIFLRLRVLKYEFHRYSNRLRLTGVIEEGEDVGEHHTINVEKGTVLTIEKEWKSFQLERVKEAVKASKAPKILIVVMDEGEADFALVMQHGVEIVASVRVNISGKRNRKNREREKKDFFEKVSKKIEEIDLPTLVCGPGFTKEEFKKFFEERYEKSLVIESCSTTSRTGIYEVLKKGLVERISKESRLSKEIKLTEEVFEKILKDEATYGFRDVEKALEYGALKKLLVVDSTLRENKDVEEFLAKAEKTGCEVHVISSEHEGGERLLTLGGIAGVLRFRV
ncbi:MAG: mRNA surveillance protein pelota [Candidatus Methanofastidiosia archaeon]